MKMAVRIALPDPHSTQPAPTYPVFYIQVVVAVAAAAFYRKNEE